MVGTLPAISIQSTSAILPKVLCCFEIRNQGASSRFPAGPEKFPACQALPHLRSKSLQTTPILGSFLIFASIAQRYLLRTCRGKPQSPMPPAGGNHGDCRAGKGGTYMKEPTYKHYDELPLFLSAAMVAQVLGISLPAAMHCCTAKASPPSVSAGGWWCPGTSSHSLVEHHTGGSSAA